MLEQSAFDFEWADPVPGALDHVAGTTLKPKVAFPARAAAVTAYDPACTDEVAYSGRVVPVVDPVKTILIGFLADQADRVSVKFPTILVDASNAESRKYLSHRAGLHRHCNRVEVSNRDCKLGRAKLIHRRDVPQRLERIDNF